MSYEYILILLGFFLAGFFLQKHFSIKLFKNIRQSVSFYGIFLLLGITWDSFAIYRGHWVYPGKGILGIYIGLMPLEDYFFILVVGYFGLVLYHVIQKRV